MKRLRHPRQPSPSQEIKTDAVLKSQPRDSKVEAKVERKLDIGKAAAQHEKEPQIVSLKQASSPSGIVAKAKERFSKEDVAHVGRPKTQEQGISAPIIKKDVSVDHKEDNTPNFVKPEPRKPADQVPLL
jgi:hypothetical protein